MPKTNPPQNCVEVDKEASSPSFHPMKPARSSNLPGTWQECPGITVILNRSSTTELATSLCQDTTLHGICQLSRIRLHEPPPLPTHTHTLEILTHNYCDPWHEDFISCPRYFCLRFKHLLRSLGQSRSKQADPPRLSLLTHAHSLPWTSK